MVRLSICLLYAYTVHSVTFSRLQPRPKLDGTDNWELNADRIWRPNYSTVNTLRSDSTASRQWRNPWALTNRRYSFEVRIGV